MGGGVGGLDPAQDLHTINPRRHSRASLGSSSTISWSSHSTENSSQKSSYQSSHHRSSSLASSRPSATAKRKTTVASTMDCNNSSRTPKTKTKAGTGLHIPDAVQKLIERADASEKQASQEKLRNVK